MMAGPKSKSIRAWKPMRSLDWDLRGIRLPSRTKAAAASKEPEDRIQPGLVGICERVATPSPVAPGAESQEGGATESSIGKKASFMDLPGELRNHIYALAIPKEECVPYLIALQGPRHFAQTVFKSPIFRLNQQIRSEAMSYKFADQRFKFYNVKIMSQFLRYIGISGRAAITSITLFGLLCDSANGYNVDCADIDESLELLPQLTHLESFDLLVEADYTEISSNFGRYVHSEKKWNCFLQLRKAVESVGASFCWEFCSGESDYHGPHLMQGMLLECKMAGVDLGADRDLGYEILGGYEMRTVDDHRVSRARA